MPGKKQSYAKKGDTRGPRITSQDRKMEQLCWRVDCLTIRAKAGKFTAKNGRELEAIQKIDTGSPFHPANGLAAWFLAHPEAELAKAA